jgi:hypothetical protein
LNPGELVLVSYRKQASHPLFEDVKIFLGRHGIKLALIASARSLASSLTLLIS